MAFGDMKPSKDIATAVMSNPNEVNGLCTNKVFIHTSLGRDDWIHMTIRCAAAAFGDLLVDQRTSVLQLLDSRVLTQECCLLTRWCSSNSEGARECNACKCYTNMSSLDG